MAAENITPVRHRVVNAVYRYLVSNKDVHAFTLVVVAVIALTGAITQSPFVYVGFPVIAATSLILGAVLHVQKDLKPARK